MITIYEFLQSKGLEPNHVDSPVKMEDVQNYLKEFAILAREEQIKYSAVGAAYYTAIGVCNVPSRLDSDLKKHLNVCRVEIS